jgi:hypothetical protein
MMNDRLQEIKARLYVQLEAHDQGWLWVRSKG